METKRRQRSYDHRLALRVHEAGDAAIATRLGVPRSTAAGWLRHARRAPTIESPAEEAVAALQRRVGRLERRCRRQAAVLRLLFVLLRVLKPDLSRVRFAGLDKARLLRAVDRTRGVLGLQRVLSVLGLSLSRLHAWARLGEGCQLDDQPSCPVATPQRLTPTEVMATLVAFYVSEHNTRIPHAAFDGQTPDEMYFGTGAAVPETLAAQRAGARRARMESNRARRCATCA